MGGRRTNLPPTLPAPPAPVAAASVPTVGEMLDRSAAHLACMLSLCEAAATKGEVGPALVRESAGLARAIVTLSSEQRAREKASRKASEELNAIAVIEWARGATRRERDEVVHAIEELNSGGRSGLA